MPGGAADAVAEIDLGAADALFRQGRHGRGQRRAGRAADRQKPDRAGLGMGQPDMDRNEHRLEMPAMKSFTAPAVPE